jgi:hypothetical protein
MSTILHHSQARPFVKLATLFTNYQDSCAWPNRHYLHSNKYCPELILWIIREEHKPITASQLRVKPWVQDDGWGLCASKQTGNDTFLSQATWAELGTEQNMIYNSVTAMKLEAGFKNLRRHSTS